MSEHDQRTQAVACTVDLPPPLPGTRYVHIPLCPVIVADDACRQRVDRWFFWPMIMLALAVLPLIALELWYLDRTEGADGGFLGWLCWIGFAVISLAFLVEFLIKIAIAESRIEYLRRNWIDVIIIVIPALRPLRATALVRSSRMFRLRGVGMKLFRYGFTFVVGLETTDRYMKKFGLKVAAGRKAPDKMTRHELMAEVARLRRRCDAWESWYVAQGEHISALNASRQVDAPMPCLPPKPLDTEHDNGACIASTPDARVLEVDRSLPGSPESGAPSRHAVPG